MGDFIGGFSEMTVIKNYLFMIIENLIVGVYRKFSLKGLVIKNYLFMIIENIIGGSSL